MKSICLLLAISSSSAMKIGSKNSPYEEMHPKEPYRIPYLEHVVEDLENDLLEKIPE